LWMWSSNRLVMEELRKEVRRNRSLILRVLSIISPSGGLLVTSVSERRENQMDILMYEVDTKLVPPGTDTVSQVIRVFVDGVEDVEQKSVIDLSPQTVPFEGPQGSTLRVEMRFKDDADNLPVDPSASVEFVAEDTIPVDLKTEFGDVRLVGEREEEPEPESDSVNSAESE